MFQTEVFQEKWRAAVTNHVCMSLFLVELGEVFAQDENFLDIEARENEFC